MRRWQLARKKYQEAQRLADRIAKCNKRPKARLADFTTPNREHTETER